MVTITSGFAMKCRRACVVAVAISFSVAPATQGQEFARVLRNGDQATLSVYGPRPVDLAAKKLVDEFGVAVNVEDPVSMYREDVQEIGVTRSGEPLLIPKAWPLETRLALRSSGSLRNVGQAVRDLAEAASLASPFQYRIAGRATNTDDPSSCRPYSTVASPFHPGHEGSSSTRIC